MSSSRPARTAPPARRAWTLRARLLAMLILVLAAVCVTVGVTTAVVLRNNLIAQTDGRLDGARDRVLAEPIESRGPGGGRPGRGEAPSFLGARGLGPGTLGAQLGNGVARWG